MYSDGREEVRAQVSDSIKKPETAAAQVSSSSIRDETGKATKQQFNSDGSV